MTFSDTHKDCAKCGRSFKRSRMDATVNCPDCRTTRRERAPEIDMRVVDAKAAAYRARREFGHDSDEAREATAAYLRVARR